MFLAFGLSKVVSAVIGGVFFIQFSQSDRVRSILKPIVCHVSSVLPTYFSLTHTVRIYFLQPCSRSATVNQSSEFIHFLPTDSLFQQGLMIHLTLVLALVFSALSFPAVSA